MPLCKPLYLLARHDISLYTRARARSDVEPEDIEQGDSALVATTTSDMVISVGLQGVSTRESGSMSTEVAGPVSTHPQLLPEGSHSSVGGRGITGSADSLQVGVTTLGYPSGLADPLDSTSVSAVEVRSQPLLLHRHYQPVAHN